MFGIYCSKKFVDDVYFYGYGKELYFWVLIVVVVLFSLGGGISIYEGIDYLCYLGEFGDLIWNYVVLGIVFVFEGVVSYFVLKVLLVVVGDKSFWYVLCSSKDLVVFIIFVEDFVVFVGIVVVFFGIYFGYFYGNLYFDGFVLVVIGVILVLVVVFLVYESCGLIIGESVDSDVVCSICVLV